jgi:hypothetical protein
MEDWRKSSNSGANGGSCVETSTGAGVILVRDTTEGDGFTLSLPAEAWAKFTATIKLARRSRWMGAAMWNGVRSAGRMSLEAPLPGMSGSPVPSEDLPPSGLLQVRLVGGPVSTEGRIRPQTSVDRFLPSPQRVDVSMIRREAGRHLRTLGNGAVAGDQDIDVPGGLTPPVECRLVGAHLTGAARVEERDQDVGEHVAGEQPDPAGASTAHGFPASRRLRRNCS